MLYSNIINALFKHMCVLQKQDPLLLLMTAYQDGRSRLSNSDVNLCGGTIIGEHMGSHTTPHYHRAIRGVLNNYDKTMMKSMAASIANRRIRDL